MKVLDKRFVYDLQKKKEAVNGSFDSFASQGSLCHREKDSYSFMFKYLLLSSELCGYSTSIYHIGLIPFSAV